MSASPGSEPALRARVRRGAGAALILVLVGLGVAAVVTAVAPRGASTVVDVATSDPAAPASVPTIYVHILGQVAAPGIYQLPDGSRVVDAVAAAGGLTTDADAAGVNLARVVGDGEQIIVPAVGESTAATGPGSGLVNINTADSAALEMLPRIGPAMAGRIIAWREANGRFSAIEDLLDVTGIGEATFAGLKDLVTV